MMGYFACGGGASAEGFSPERGFVPRGGFCPPRGGLQRAFVPRGVLSPEGFCPPRGVLQRAFVPREGFVPRGFFCSQRGFLFPEGFSPQRFFCREFFTKGGLQGATSLTANLQSVQFALFSPRAICRHTLNRLLVAKCSIGQGFWRIGVFSSVGRATALQAVGRRFDPCNTHQSCTGSRLSFLFSSLLSSMLSSMER